MGFRTVGRLRAGAALLSTIALLVVPVGGALASPAERTERVHPSTRANVMKAMEAEGLAHAAYQAYAIQADKERLPRVRDLYDRTAAEEFRRHFTEQAKLAGLLGNNADNLRDAIRTEAYEASSLYRRFAAEAKADGEIVAFRLFTEIGQEEADHRDRFDEALAAIKDPSSGAHILTDVSAEATTIPVGGPRVRSARTLRNLHTTMRREALAYAKYTLYAEHAEATDVKALATLFHRTARVELTEHFAEAATLAGLVRDTRTNVCHTIFDQTYEAHRLYGNFAQQAAEVGDRRAARLLLKAKRAQERYAHAFVAALSKIGGRCPGKR
ncbi:ferritin family protein [Thermopolyspora sp. NPDC052614]|uniref:ferritin family protein n=1 Tax=Thermopolyspora sp. NPDC052614 TaxID=3155682 RepID=UPI00343E7030